MERYALQLKISLIGVKPLIWRRVVVNSDISLGDLHDVIQTVMLWSDTHLHKFYDKHQTYMMPFDGCEYEDQQEQIEAYEEALVEDILTEKGQHLKYEYDFGDSWIHDILVEEILPPIEGYRDAIFIKGKNATPPEDCGGIWGYERLRKIMANPKDPEYDDMAEWLGLFDEETFDPTDMGSTVDEFNDMLSEDPNYSGEPMVGDSGLEMLERVLADPKLPKEFQDSLIDALSQLKKK